MPGLFAQARLSLSSRAPALVTLLVALGLAGLACLPWEPLLSEVHLSRAAISPDGRGAAPAAELHYTLARSARVDVYLAPGQGERVYLRRDEPRPTGGSYVFRFDGTHPLPDDPLQRRVVPDGRYRLVVEARDAGGHVEQAAREVVVEGGDTAPPAIERLIASPERLTPDFDGVDDVAHISYRLTKAARVGHSVVDEAGGRRWIGQTQRRSPGEYSENWNALARGSPLPDGRYLFQVRAEDEAGNVTIGRVPILVQAAGLPRARILDLAFSPRRLTLGDLLRVEARVRNEGTVTLRTQGPDPGYTYSSYDNYFSIAEGTLVDKAGRWRVGVDWAGSPGAFGGKYPYRWGFGKDLAPGEETTVVGYIRVLHEDQRARFGDRPDYHRMIFFGALVQEGVAIHQDRVGQTEISLSF